MNSRFVSTLCIPVLALSIVACKQPAPQEQKTIVDTESSSSEAQAEEFTGEIGELMKRGKDVTCTFTRTDEGGTVTGTVYVARDGRMRGNVAMSNVDFGDMTVQMIRDGDYGYTWGFPSADKGMKVKLDDDGRPVKQDEDSPVDEAMTYECESWKVDASMFAVPADVEFTDISEQMEKINDAMGDVKAAQCGACDNVPEGQGREQCKQALGC